MKILIDTNIILDYLVKRDPFYEYANKIFTLCGESDIQGAVAAHSITNCFYILKRTYSAAERRELLLHICNITDVVGIDSHEIISALNNKNFSDFEDCVQSECAINFGANFIITRNIKDFEKSSIPAILPDDFLDIIY